MSYNHMDHAVWVEENNKASNQLYGKRSSYKPRPESLTPFQAKVMDILGMVGGGIYNAPINWDKLDWGTGHSFSGMFVPWRDGRMATFDFYALTNLVFLCHEARIRCEVRSKSAGNFELSFFQRSHEGGIGRRHPNIDEAVTAFRQYLPADHRIIYRADDVQETAGEGGASMEKDPAGSIPINLLLADVRQALFDGTKADDGAGTALRYEVGRAVGLMGRAMDSIAALADAVNALLPSNLGSLNSDDFPDDFSVPVDMTAGEIRQARAAIEKAMGGKA